MAAKSRKARKIREASEFDVSRLRADGRTPKVSPGAYSWELSTIVDARNQQMRGYFTLPARLAASMRTDDALYVAYANRLDALASVEKEIKPAPGARAVGVASEAEALFGQTGVALTHDTERDFHGCLVNHGVAFLRGTWLPREDGSRVDLAIASWPIEHVRWDSYDRCYKTQTDGGVEEPITHGDGRWAIAQLGEIDPFKSGALLPAAMVWARHAFAARDWAKGSVSHGSAKVIGKMAEGVPLRNADGMTQDAIAFLDALQSIASGDSPVAIIPAGASIEYLVNTSTAYQVWIELVANAEKAAARIYLGTDGVLGAAGGAPGVDIQALFGVATTKIQGDRKAIERAIQTGFVEPWCAINFGDSRLAPLRTYKLPDADADAARASDAERTVAFFDEVEKTRANGFDVSQEYVNGLAKKHGIDAPVLPSVEDGAQAPTIALAPTDLARVISVNEARASAGLGALRLPDGSDDADGLLTVEQFGIKKAADAAPVVAPAPVAAPPLAVATPEPSPMEKAVHASRMTAAIIADIREMKALGLSLTQKQINETAERYGVPAPKMESN
jgi:hypothetical protein